MFIGGWITTGRCARSGAARSATLLRRHDKWWIPGQPPLHDQPINSADERHAKLKMRSIERIKYHWGLIGMYQLDIFLGDDLGEPICQKAAGRNDSRNDIGMAEKCQGKSCGADHLCYWSRWLIVPHRAENEDVMAAIHDFSAQSQEH